MLAKVMKYEFKSSARMQLPLLGVTLGFSVVVGIITLLLPRVFSFGSELAMLGGVLTFTLIPTVLTLLSGVFIAVRYYQGLVGPEGYLTFTLPVKVSTHIWGRVLVGGTWYAAAIAMTALCMWVSGAFREYAALMSGAGSDIYAELYAMVPHGQVAVLVALFVLMLLASAVTGALQMMICIALGSRFGGKAGGAVAAYFIISTVEGVAMLILMALVAAGFFAANGGFAGLDAMFSRIATEADVMAFVFTMLTWVYAICILLMVLFAVIHFFWSKHIFEKKLNLE